jgi:hypothetical protein
VEERGEAGEDERDSGHAGSLGHARASELDFVDRVAADADAGLE